LWIAHLAQLSQLDDLHESWLLREELYRHLGPLESGMTVLDIGCGQGSLAQLILTSQAYRQLHHSGPPELTPRYIGVDQSHESLQMADQQVQAYAHELTAALSVKLLEPRLLNIQWVQSDWDSPSPCREESVTKLLFHLSLAFCPSPLHAVRQAIQSLHADGTMIITCFRPTTDLSVLFRRHLRTSGQDEFAPGVQVVLHYLGRLREAIRHGLLHSYERQALEQLLLHAGAIPIRSLPLADGQLLLAIARKGNSAG
jgi:SAM-dependent methyltransferase